MSINDSSFLRSSTPMRMTAALYPAISKTRLWINAIVIVGIIFCGARTSNAFPFEVNNYINTTFDDLPNSVKEFIGRDIAGVKYKRAEITGPIYNLESIRIESDECTDNSKYCLTYFEYSGRFKVSFLLVCSEYFRLYSDNGANSIEAITNKGRVVVTIKKAGVVFEIL